MYDQPPQPTQTNPFAIVSIVLGGISVFTCWCCYGFPFNVLGLIFGIVALVQSSSDPSQGGKGLAFGGIGLSVASGLLAIGWVVFSVFFMTLAEQM